jgi:hypothetical protein
MGGFRECTGVIVPEAVPQGKCDKRRAHFKSGAGRTKKAGHRPRLDLFWWAALFF